MNSPFIFKSPRAIIYIIKYGKAEMKDFFLKKKRKKGGVSHIFTHICTMYIDIQRLGATFLIKTRQ